MSNQRNARRDKVWVSHNRVLNGGNKKNVRNPNFDTEETKLLINLWGNPAIQKTLITSHKKFPIISKLSEAMRQYGYQRTPEEINTRLKNLKCLYNRLKKDVEFGKRSHPTWKHFSAMDAILTRPIFGYQANDENPDEDEGEIDQLEEDELRPEDLLQLETSPGEIFPADDDDVVIKDEPIDVDEYEPVGDPEKLQVNPTEVHRTMTVNIEKLPKLIPRSSWLNNSSNNNSSAAAVAAREQNPPPPLQNAQSRITRQNSVICVSSPRSLATVTSTTNSSHTTNMPNGSAAVAATATAATSPTSPNSKGKISLVPTNLLINQQKQQQQQQQHLLGKNYFVSQNVSTITQTSVTSQSGNDPNKPKMPMKVLLVNTMPKPQQAPPQRTQPPTPTSQAVISTAPTTVDQVISSQSVKSQPPPTRRIIPKRRPTKSSLSIPGIKTLLSSLIRTQQEANSLTKQRLLMDRERFNYERRVVDEFTGLVPILKELGAQLLHSQRGSGAGVLEQHHVHPTSTALDCNGHDANDMEVAAEEELEISDT